MFMSSNPVLRQKEGPSRSETDRRLEEYVARFVRTKDANDVLYAIESSRDYDPGPGLEKIRAPLLAINFADDLINPPELGILEQAIQRVKHGKALVMPRSDRTQGHGTHTLAAVWKDHLDELLKRSSVQGSRPAINGPGLEISPRLSPAGRYFFFSNACRVGDPGAGERPNRTRSGLGDIYRMDLSALHELAR
jgi:hypothetical protein